MKKILFSFIIIISLFQVANADQDVTQPREKSVYLANMHLAGIGTSPSQA